MNASAPRPDPGPAPADPAKLEVRHLDFFYGRHQALKDISLTLGDRSITAFIGPSGCGKSTLLRVFNRMYTLYPGHRATGEVRLDGEDILSPRVDAVSLRFRVGMVFQKPTPFPMSIFDNVAYGLRLRGIRKKSILSEKVEHALKQSAIWEEVKDKLHESAYALSGGQQQRLVIARALAVEPEALLFDEPTSALDPISTAKIEELIEGLKENVTIIIVTHNLQQAARISEWTGFLMLGELVEFDRTEKIFTVPKEKLTEDYVTGRFG